MVKGVRVQRRFLQEEIMAGKSTALRRLLADEAFIHIPVAYDTLGGRLIEQTGFKAAYVGGFVTGASRCTSEPLLTLDEQVRVAGDVAKAVGIPVLADAGAGLASRCTRCALSASSSMRGSRASISRTSCSRNGRTITNTSPT
jgi:2-methylisocitrate lyase-like PEP mutase family enzyme